MYAALVTSPDWNVASVTTAERETLAGHRGAVVWFTGLSGSGKTTVARHLERQLYARGLRTFLLDGDILREGITADLGFSADDRAENLRRFTELARLFADAGVITLVSAIAPYEESRRHALERIGADRFVLVHMATPLEVCESRDPKGLYAQAREGKIAQFTGIDSPYEEPKHPDLRLAPTDGTPPELADRVYALLRERALVGVQRPAPVTA